MAQPEIEEALATGAPRASSFGRYRVGPLIGVGGMGTVHLAWGPDDQPVALKRLLPRLSGKSAFVRMFRTEADICRVLHHPNIVRFIEHGEVDGEPFLVTELVRGVSCRRLMRGVVSRGESLSVAAAVEIVLETLSALACAHSAMDDEGRPLRIVHRDVSPGNLLVTRSGSVKLIDFGIVQSTRSIAETHPGELKGKPGYMSPEQVAGRPLDHRSDLFSLGAVLGELLTLRPVFFGSDEFTTLSRMYEADLGEFEKRAARAPAPLVEVVRKALRRDPNDRHATADDFHADLSQAAARCGIDCSKPNLLEFLEHVDNAPPQSGVYRAPFLDARSSARSDDRVSPSLLSGLRPMASSPRAAGRVSANVRSAGNGSASGVRSAGNGSASGVRSAGNGSATSGIRGGASVTIDPSTAVRDTELRTDDPAVDHVMRALRCVATGRSRSLDGPAALPGLSFFAERAPYRFFELPGAPSFVARAAEGEAARVLSVLRQRKATGLLVAKDGERQARLYFRNGVPSFGSSTDPEHLLGERLVRNAALDERTLRDALVHSYRNRCRLGQSLLHLGALRAGPLLRALIAQLSDRVRDVSTWSDGELSFFEGADAGVTAASADLPFDLIDQAPRTGEARC